MWMELFLGVFLRCLKSMSKSRAVHLKYACGCYYVIITVALKSSRTRSMENTQLMLNNQEILSLFPAVGRHVLPSI